MCTLKCPACARTKFIEQWPQHWKNHNLDVDLLMQFIDVPLDNLSVNFCGNYGDPIYHPNMLEIVRAFKKRNAIVNITTNGSYKDQDWWYQLTSLLDSRDEITFSVDGSPENFDQYRINGDWSSIRKGMETVASSLCKSVWKYIVFAYNEHCIESTRSLSNSIGIKQFKLEYSDRFDESTAEYMPVNTELLGTRYSGQQKWKNQDNVYVSPLCSKDKKQHFITADGFYSPCCFIADHRFYYKTQFGKNKKHYDIRNQTFSELIKKQEVIDFYNNLDNTPACQFNCPKI